MERGRWRGMKSQKSYWISQIRRTKTSTRPQKTDGPLHEWLQRYHDLICDYLVNLAPRELSGWHLAYTALHEMLGAVWTGRTTNDPAAIEQDAWQQFRPIDYLTNPARAFSFLPPNFERALFLPHFVGFTQFVGQQRSLPSSTVDRVCAEWTVLLSSEVVAA
ncbi:MAG: hypothetical protein ACI9KE_004669 [Polyangiales bacterium]|jgi:hypothetical protein